MQSKKSPPMSWRVEKCIGTQGSGCGESLVLCSPRKTLQVQASVTVHCTWVFKATYVTDKYRNCSVFRQKIRGLRVQHCDKDQMLWQITAAVQQKGPCQGDSGTCGTTCFLPCAFLHSSMVWQGLQRPQRTTRRLCLPGLPAVVVTASASCAWRTVGGSLCPVLI